MVLTPRGHFGNYTYIFYLFYIFIYLFIFILCIYFFPSSPNDGGMLPTFSTYRPGMPDILKYAGLSHTLISDPVEISKVPSCKQKTHNYLSLERHQI